MILKKCTSMVMLEENRATEELWDNEEQYYKDGISKMLSAIHNMDWLRSIYSFTKVFADDEEGEIEYDRLQTENN